MEESEYQMFSFKGSGGEYFKIWIVNIALTILTFGIYSAWAKVRTNRYIYANTYLNGSNFEYNADPFKILIGRIIVIGVYASFVIFSEYLMMFEVAGVIAFIAVLLMPWLVRQAISFKLRNTSYRNIPFKFKGKTSDFYLFFITHGILNIITLFIAFPYSYVKFKKLVINNSEYGDGKFNFKGTTGEAYSTYLLIFVWSAVFLIGLMSILGVLGTIIAGSIGIDDLNTTSKMASILSDVNSSMIIDNNMSIVVDNNISVDNNITLSNDEMNGMVGLMFLVSMLFSIIIYMPMLFWYRGFSDGYFSNFVRNSSSLDTSPLKGTIKPFTLGMIALSNMFMVILSLGLLYPWAKIRYLRYKLENTHFKCSNYAQFESLGYEQGSTVGEEMVDFFDIEIGL